MTKHQYKLSSGEALGNIVKSLFVNKYVGDINYLICSSDLLLEMFKPVDLV